MIRFSKGDNQSSRFKIEFASFLAGEGTGVTIATINSFTVISGDVALGTGAKAPALTDSSSSIVFYVSGGTSGTLTTFEILYTISNGDQFDCQVQFIVTDSTQ